MSTQIVQRDRHAALLAAIAILGGTLERLATEVRNLQHTEIGEVMEPFKRGQKGCSAMPHKRNPILSERIAGLARLLRGYAQTAFENQPLWHERDISHSSAERVILPDATILLDYLLAKTTGLVEGLVVRPERMRENIERGLGLHASSRVLLALVEQAGLSREEAYAVVQRERAPRRRRAGAAPRAPRHRPRSSPRSCRSPRSTRASTTRRCCATCPRSSPGSTRSRRRSAPGRTPRPGRRPPVPLAEAFVRSGKVRDLYRVDDDRLLLVASDRLSAFDVVLPTPIPDKGRVLTGLSRFWFHETASIVPNHLLSTDPADVPGDVIGGDPAVGADLRGRMMLGRLAEVIPVECVVRGYLSGSGWKEYQATRIGLRRPAPRRPPRVRPPARADLHAGLEGAPGRARREHPVRAGRRARRRRARRSRSARISLALYASSGPRCASGRGSSSPTRSTSSASSRTASLVLIDEVMTPDSSRFWDAADVRARPCPGELRQAVRPQLAAEPSRGTRPRPARRSPPTSSSGPATRYVEAFERITGASFARYLEEDVIAR